MLLISLINSFLTSFFQNLRRSPHISGFLYQIPLLGLSLERVDRQLLIFSHNLEQESSCLAVMNFFREPLIGLSWFLEQLMKLSRLQNSFLTNCWPRYYLLHGSHIKSMFFYLFILFSV